MQKCFSIVAVLLASTAAADVQTVIETHIVPAYLQLAETSRVLSDVAAVDCTPETLRPAFHDAYDAWISISHIQFGPLEDHSFALAMSFWPDPKDSTGKAIARLSSTQDPIVDDVEEFAEVSVAALGFTALERLLYDPQPDTDYSCRLTRAITLGIADRADVLNDAWPEFAALMSGTENTRFQSAQEVERTIYTSLSTGLEFLHDQRLGRPLGSFERPRPLRAEARRSERSLRHVQLTLEALEALAVSFYDGNMPETLAAFADAKARAANLNDPTLGGVANPGSRIRIEALQGTVRDIENAVNTEIGKPLGITAGFNALDGD